MTLRFVGSVPVSALSAVSSVAGDSCCVLHAAEIAKRQHTRQRSGTNREKNCPSYQIGLCEGRADMSLSR